MSELSKSLLDIFTPDNPDVHIECINGYDIPVIEMTDSIGSYLAIPALHKDLSNICNSYVCGHYIEQIDYDSFNGKNAIIKAYYH